jgi:hypothetical protein
VYEIPINEYLLEGGCRKLHPIVIGEHGIEVKSTLGRVRSQLTWGKRNFVWPKREVFIGIFLHEQQAKNMEE